MALTSTSTVPSAAALGTRSCVRPLSRASWRCAEQGVDQVRVHLPLRRRMRALLGDQRLQLRDRAGAQLRPPGRRRLSLRRAGKGEGGDARDGGGEEEQRNGARQLTGFPLPPVSPGTPVAPASDLRRPRCGGGGKKPRSHRRLSGKGQRERHGGEARGRRGDAAEARRAAPLAIDATWVRNRRGEFNGGLRARQGGPTSGPGAGLPSPVMWLVWATPLAGQEAMVVAESGDRPGRLRGPGTLPRLHGLEQRSIGPAPGRRSNPFNLAPAE